jgi:uncharacterized membrane protein
VFTARLVAMTAWLAVAAGPAVTAAAAQAGKATEVEEIQDVTPVEPAAHASAGSLIGRLHPAVVHFPIAWVLLLVLVETAATITARDDLSRAGFALLVLACLSFVPAGVTGFLRAAAMGSDPELKSLMLPHRNLNIAAAVACFAALALRTGLRDRFVSRHLRVSYLLLLAGSAALLSLAGHLGGKMVFGSDFLPF